jgi:MFS family permease
LALPLAFRNFRNLWIGQSVSLVGDQFKFVALSWLVLSLTGRSGALGTVLMLQAIPRSVLMLAGGVASDRLRPRAVMLGSDLIRAAIELAIVALVVTNLIRLPHLYLLALLFGIVQAFFFPAAMAMTPEVVPPHLLGPANAVTQVTNQVVLAAAPAAAGFVIGTVGTAGGFAVDAATFIVSALFLVMIAVPQRAQAGRRQSAWRDFLEGVAFVRHRPLLLSVILMAAVFFFGHSGATYVGLPVLVRGPFRAGPQSLGILFSAYGAGALVGGMVAGTRQARRRGLIGPVLVVGMGMMIAGIALAQHLWQAAALLACAGAAMSWLGITYVTVVQQRTEREFMGRVMGMMMFGIYGLYPVSYGLAGWLAELIGVRALFIGGGALIALSGLVGLSVREHRTLD